MIGDWEIGDVWQWGGHHNYTVTRIVSATRGCPARIYGRYREGGAEALMAYDDEMHRQHKLISKANNESWFIPEDWS